jgi:glycosyltransferase involved in cell wall biosynthesis
LKVGFFSPLPPARTGVADYSAELLRALNGLGQVDVNSSADVSLYHLGNNPLHREIYRRALERPGVIVLHDAVLHHFFLGSLKEREYTEEFVYNYGAWTEDLARDLWRRRSRSGSDPEYFQYPMLKRVVERSLGVIVHNPRAAAMVARHAPVAVVYEIPHLFAPPVESPAQSDVLRLRDQLGIAPRVFLLGVFGHLRESKRLASVLRAFHRARVGAEIALLVAGDFASRDLARSLAPLLQQDTNIRCVGYLTERDFWRNAAAVDACINLRYPAAGETSGIAIRLMGIGKPVLVSEGKEVARFPDNSCLRVDTGAAEEEMLAEYMVWLARFPDDARAIGQRAAAYIGQYHSPARIAESYWQALADCYHRV